MMSESIMSESIMSESIMSNNNENSPELNDSTSADMIYVWSIRHQKLMCVSKADIKNNSVECQICIPIYRFREKERKLCEMKFTSMNQFKSHVRHCENVWRRELFWTKKTEIPANLRREREIGDLSSLQDEIILKIEFATEILIFRKDSILAYFKKNRCNCKDEFGLKCQVITMGTSLFHFFSHLSHVERSQNRYVLFKATEDELYNEDNKCSPILIKPNNQSTARQISADELESVMRKKGRSFRKSLSNSFSSDQIPSALSSRSTTIDKASNRIKLSKNQSTHKSTKTRNSNKIQGSVRSKNIKKPSFTSTDASEGNQSPNLSFNLLETVYYYDGKEQPFPRDFRSYSSDDKPTAACNDKTIPVLYDDESKIDQEDDQATEETGQIEVTFDNEMYSQQSETTDSNSSELNVTGQHDNTTSH